MKEKRTKTLEYRRTRFFTNEQGPKPLQALVEEAWEKLETQEKRSVTFRDSQSICGLRSRKNLSGFAIHCGRYTDGQSVATISMKPASQASVGERPPEKDENFLSADFMALIRDNHVICMNCGRNAGSLRRYLHELFRKAGFSDDLCEFKLVLVANPGALMRLNKFGVKAVEIPFTIKEITADKLERSVRTGDRAYGWIKQVFASIGDIVLKDPGIEGLKKSQKGRARLIINVPKGDLELAKDGLNNLGMDMVEDEEAEDYIIHLHGGGIIKPGQMSVKKKISIRSRASSVEVEGAWKAMENYIDELAKIEQLRA